MKLSIVSFVILFLTCSAGHLSAGTPRLQAGVYINNVTYPIELNGHSAPAVADWNEDGSKDLVVGNGQGNIRLFLNQGTDLNPRFNGGTLIKSGGSPIETSYS